MKIAIVGSRGYPDLAVVRRYVSNLPRGTVIVSGGARGVDSAAERMARDMGYGRLIYRPDPEIVRARGFAAAAHARNRQIAEACDQLVAFSFNCSPGTASTVRYAREIGKPVTVYEWPEVPA